MAIEPLADRFARWRAEHRGQQRAAVFQCQQLRGVFPHHGHRTVGGAVVKTNKHRLQNPHAGEEGGATLADRRQADNWNLKARR